MSDAPRRDEAYFHHEVTQAESALAAIARQAPLLVATGKSAELGVFIDRFVAMAGRSIDEARAHGADPTAQRLGELVAAAEAIRATGQN